MKSLLKDDPVICRHVSNVRSIPGAGLIYALNFFIVTEGFAKVDYRNLASFLGVVPHEHTSGTSVYRKPRSDKQGSYRMRKQLYLSALSVIRNDGPFKRYFMKKQREGKPARLILNNIANKILRMSCAIIKSGQPYDPEYKSLHLP